MKTLLEKLKNLHHISSSHKLTTAEIILYQRNLDLNFYQTIPSEYVEFLHNYNSFHYNGSHLFGINPNQDKSFDIIFENQIHNLPFSEFQLLLGYNDIDFLIFNSKENTYQLIDKDSYLVLNSYPALAIALHIFLRLDK